MLSHLCEPGSVNNHRHSTKRPCAARSVICCFVVGARAPGAESKMLFSAPLALSITQLFARCRQVPHCHPTAGMCLPEGWLLAEGLGALCCGFPVRAHRFVPSCLLLLVSAVAPCLHQGPCFSCSPRRDWVPWQGWVRARSHSWAE